MNLSIVFLTSYCRGLLHSKEKLLFYLLFSGNSEIYGKITILLCMPVAPDYASLYTLPDRSELVFIRITLMSEDTYPWTGTR